MLPRHLLLAAVAILGAVAAAVAQQPQQQPLASRTDRAGLHSIRASLGLRARDWPLKSDPCNTWAGVTCRGGRVVSLTVSGLRRTRLASLAPSFSLDGLQTLTSLELFNASNFPLPGPLPPWFATALPPSLTILDLRSAAVNGTLPAGLGASGNLTRLLLSGNRLSGPVPGPLLSVRTLRVLDLSANNLTGALPNVSVSLAAAELFNVSGNSLYGVATYAVGALKTRFRLVDVSANYLDGIWDGSDATVDVTANCFSGVPGQRQRADCQEFYQRQGARLVDIPAPAPSPQPQPQPSSKKSRRISKNLLIGIIAAAAALMALFLLALLLCYMRKKGRRQRGGGTRGVETNEEGARSARRRDSSVNPVASSPVAMSPTASTTPKDTLPDFGDLSFEKLVHATGGFADDNLLKHGHSGDIYHGVLENGADVIVKKIGAKSANKNSGELDFYSRYSHQRIVPLLGHLANGDEEFLAYKYMPKADLTNALHKKPVDTEDGLSSLDWITRLKIAIGVAEAMCFLHDECSPPLVHRDIQASSVLLDDKFEVRLGSMSNICAQQSAGSQNVFTRILRSSKSLDKNASVPPATSSYDVYCFGKVILELVTGNFGVSGSNNAGSEEWLANTTNRISVNDKDSIANIIDPLLLVDEDHLEEVWAVAIVAKTCLNSKPSRRPSARYVLKALENPLRVVRAGSRSNSARLRSSSSRSSWQSAFVQGNRYQSYEIMSASGRMLDRRGSVRSHISGGGEASSSFKRSLREIAPDPQVLDEDVVV